MNRLSAEHRGTSRAADRVSDETADQCVSVSPGRAPEAARPRAAAADRPRRSRGLSERQAGARPLRKCDLMLWHKCHKERLQWFVVWWWRVPGTTWFSFSMLTFTLYFGCTLIFFSYLI